MRSIGAYGAALRRKVPHADELFLYCFSHFSNLHICVHFDNCEWSTTDRTDLVSIELACVGLHKYVILQRDDELPLNGLVPCDVVDAAAIDFSVPEYCEDLLLRAEQNICVVDAKLEGTVFVRVRRYEDDNLPLSVHVPGTKFRGPQLRVMLD